MEIQIKIQGLPSKKIGMLEPFQNSLKKITSENLERLKRSILQKGIIAPIYLWEGHDYILDGHQRLTAVRALIEEGHTLKDDALPYLPIEAATHKEAAELVLAYSARYGDITPDGIAQFIDKFELNPYELDTFMNFEFKPVELPFGADDINPDEELPEMPTETDVKAGDVYQLGDHYLMCGDSTKEDDIAKLTGGGGIDMVVTSPPYNVGIKYQSYEDKQARDKYFELIKQVLENCQKVLKPGRFICWNVGTSPTTHPYEHANKMTTAGFTHYREIIWQKTGIAKPVYQNSTNNPKARNYKPNYMHEIVFMATNGAISLGEVCEMPEDASGDVWYINASNATTDIPTIMSDIANPNYAGKMKKKAHPAVFPVKLPLTCMQTLTARSERVLDPFGGAGTSLIAAEKAHRQAFIMELDPIYVQLTIDRWGKYTSQKAVKMGSADANIP